MNINNSLVENIEDLNSRICQFTGDNLQLITLI